MGTVVLKDVCSTLLTNAVRQYLVECRLSHRVTNIQCVFFGYVRKKFLNQAHDSSHTHLLSGSSVQCDSGGSESGAVGAGRDDRAPGAGCGWSEGRGAAAGGGGGAAPGRGCVGGGGCRRRRFPHPESAGRSRRSGPVGWSHRASPSNLSGEKEDATTCHERGEQTRQQPKSEKE